MAKLIHDRPKIISILGVVGFVFSAGQIIAISAPSIRDVASWYPILFGSIICLRFISMIGVWHMKKWGAELFTYVSLTKIIIQLLVDDFGLSAKIDCGFSIVFIITFLFYYKKMARGL